MTKDHGSNGGHSVLALGGGSVGKGQELAVGSWENHQHALPPRATQMRHPLCPNWDKETARRSPPALRPVVVAAGVDVEQTTLGT